MPRISLNLIALFALVLSTLIVSPAAAHYSEPCWVVATGYYSRFWPNRNYSRLRAPAFAVKCNYATGTELNERAGYERFATDRLYVVILWLRSGPSYIRVHQSLQFCGDVAEPGCATSIAGRLTGHDDRSDPYDYRIWVICQPGFFDRYCYQALGGWRD